MYVMFWLILDYLVKVNQRQPCASSVLGLFSCKYYPKKALCTIFRIEDYHEQGSGKLSLNALSILGFHARIRQRKNHVLKTIILQGTAKESLMFWKLGYLAMIKLSFLIWELVYLTRICLKILFWELLSLHRVEHLWTAISILFIANMLVGNKFESFKELFVWRTRDILPRSAKVSLCFEWVNSQWSAKESLVLFWVTKKN